MINNENYILITGATSGFGEATAIEFSKMGWNIIITGRRNERLLQLKETLKKNYYNDIIALNFDIRNQNEVISAIQSLSEKVKRKISILVNNAGLAAGRSPIDEGNIDDWEQMIDTNIKGLLYITKEITPIFKENKRGHIVNISSIAGKENYADGNVYCASKHAVDSLSNSMRIDLLKYGIKVTNIAPGAANTEFSSVRYKGDQDKVKATYEGFQPLMAQDIAETIYFVCSRPSHVTINDLVIMPTTQANATLFHKS
jgi:3-hydroxy acid dehydrogenase/malonic semialdehyde reductase